VSNEKEGARSILDRSWIEKTVISADWFNQHTIGWSAAVTIVYSSSNVVRMLS